jgi:hypothetical protein
MCVAGGIRLPCNPLETLRRVGESREFIEAFTKKATSGDYNHLLATVMEVVEIE